MLLIDGKEDFGVSQPKSGDFTSYGYRTNAIYNGQYEFQDEKLIERYIQIKDFSKLQGIPVIVTTKEAEELFGENYIGKTYQACYRNSVERGMLNKIAQDYADIKNNVGNKDYTEPALQYDYPAEGCGDIIVKRDKRTASEKKSAADQDKVLAISNQPYLPEHELITFQIVGAVNVDRIDKSTDIRSSIKSMLNTSDDSSGNIIPLQMYQKLPESIKSERILSSNQSSIAEIKDFGGRVLEFKSINSAKAFLDNEVCSVGSTECTKAFSGSTFGANYLMIDDLRSFSYKVISIVLLSVIGLAVLVMVLTVNKSMADNRKETAVYRSMGASRSDIFKIYFVYSLLISILILFMSVVFGVTISLIIATIYNPELAKLVAESAGRISSISEINLFSLEAGYVSMLGLAILASCMIASVPSIALNTLRPPIKDLREE